MIDLTAFAEWPIDSISDVGFQYLFKMRPTSPSYYVVRVRGCYHRGLSPMQLATLCAAGAFQSRYGPLAMPCEGVFHINEHALHALAMILPKVRRHRVIRDILYDEYQAWLDAIYRECPFERDRPMLSGVLRYQKRREKR